jgi:hypothetical protein
MRTKQIESLDELISASAIVSNVDKRVATLLRLEDDGVVLKMELIGERKFPYHTIRKGFSVLVDFEDAVIEILRREVDNRTELSNKDCYIMSCRFYDLFSDIVKGTTNEKCYKVIRGFFPLKK